MKLEPSSAITDMAFDEASKTLILGDCEGTLRYMSQESEDELKLIELVKNDKDTSVISLGVLNRGSVLTNVVVAGYQNGAVKLFSVEGKPILEIQAHYRCLNALACHPSKSVFCSVGDDTFMNLFELSGDKHELISISVRSSTPVKDLNLVGVQFYGADSNSIIAAPYDYSTLAYWENLI